VAHAAFRVSGDNFRERLFSFFILERVEPGDGAIELPLGLGSARDSETDLTEFFPTVVLMSAVLMSLLGAGGKGVTVKR
jgi:hypothetical protein